MTILPGAALRVTVQAVYDFARELWERVPAAEEAFIECCVNNATIKASEKAAETA